MEAELEAYKAAVQALDSKLDEVMGALSEQLQGQQTINKQLDEINEKQERVNGLLRHHLLVHHGVIIAGQG